MPARSLRSLAATSAVVAVLTSCSSGAGSGGDSDGAVASSPVVTDAGEIESTANSSTTVADVTPAAPRLRFRYPPAPPAPGAAEPGAPDALAAIDSISQLFGAGQLDIASVARIGETGDLRNAWYLADLLRFFGGDDGDRIVGAFERLADISIDGDPDSQVSRWLSVTNHLIAWDTPAYPGYREDKAGIYLEVEPAWEPFFNDDDATIDWRLVGWGGVFIDDRPLGDTEPCRRGCIPALDDPVTTDASGGDWYPDDLIVFGLVEGGETLAVPKNIAEIHEMFNLTLGGRRIALPYCTLCGSAQAYYTDNTLAAQQPVLRTSGLLIRPNKMMYDLVTSSVVDTFTGAAVSGPLRDAGVLLEETSVVRSTWGEWKVAHPETRIIAEDGGIGRTYDLDPLRGRDADGPIFPIGDADARLDVQELVVGVIARNGTPVAFPADLARGVVAADGDIEFGGVTLTADGGGLRAVDTDSGEPLAAHESFWFAWSQFHPDTLVWPA